MNYIIQTKKSFEQTLKDIEIAVEKHAFRIQHIHNVSEVLNEKGFKIERYSIIEICNPKFAYKVLSKNKNYGSILPCKIIVYEDKGNLFISAPKPSEMVAKLSMHEISDVALEVENIIREILIEVEE